MFWFGKSCTATGISTGTGGLLKGTIKCKNIFTEILKDVGIEVPKSIEVQNACMQATTGNDSMQQS